MPYDCILVESDGPYVTVTMNLPERRNALSRAHLLELLDAFGKIGASNALGVVLAGRGPVFSAGHDLAELAGAELDQVRELLSTCTDLMELIQAVPQVVIARVHGLATAAGCQLVASCDLAVAAKSATFALPGGKGGWFCTTPLVAVGRSVSRKHALEMALTGDPIDADTAAGWGLVNRVVPDDALEQATVELLERATRGSAVSRALGKQAFYTQIGMEQYQAYRYAVEVMAAASQIDDAREGVSAFLEKRAARWAAPSASREGVNNSQ
ncbi:MAG: enoyl-CoA hydratase-related protein [Acidimicrobiales bacterium]|nr:enoyl-CoA hydratase-related protein [Acidimicrobiales bacterium]